MQNTNNAWWRIDNIDDIDSPSLVIYTERVLANIRTAKGVVRELGLLRPHVKTHKSPEASLLQISEGITRFKCATIAEAEMLARAGAADVLLAYQPVGPKIRRLRALTKKYPRTTFACLVDDMTAAQSIAAAFADEPAPLRVFIDLDVGMGRTGIRPGDAARRLYNACGLMRGLTPAGLHAYDGHIQDTNLSLRSERSHAAFEAVRAMQKELTETGSGNPLIVAGGSPTFPIHALRGDVECSPGTFIYWDKSYLDGLPDQAFLPAALVIARVISHPATNVLCLDLGHKSVAAEKDIRHRVFFLNAPNAGVLSQSEEHLVLKAEDSGSHPIGEVFYGLPYHICPTCALYERATTITAHRADGEWTMAARDRTMTV